MSPLGALGRLSVGLFAPVRRLAGPFHRSSDTLTAEQKERQRNLPPLPPPWCDDDRWYRGDFPPRRHNELLPIPHGAPYFKDLIEALGSATKRVTLCDWCLTPLMTLGEDENGERQILADVLNEVSRHAEVYVLLWSGAPALFEPSVHYVKQVRKTLLSRAPAVHCELDHHAPFSHDHHQKAVTIDGTVAYVGGIDLTTYEGNRLDTAEHPLRFGPNWHDVQVRMRGEVVRDVEENFCQRWNAVTGEDLHPLEPRADPNWDTPAQIVRSVPAGFYAFAPKGEYGIHHAIVAGIRRAERFIYLENQYIWLPAVVDALCDAMDRPHDGPFRIVMVLPADADMGKYDNNRHVIQLRRANRGRGIFEAYSLYSSGPETGRTGYEYRPIYVHAKVTIVDDEWFSVGSANLNGRGLGTDTEMNVQAVAPEIARRLRVQLWAEHLAMTEEQVEAADPISLIDREWKEAAATLGRCKKAGGPPPEPQIHRYDTGRGPLFSILDRIQSLTLEH